VFDAPEFHDRRNGAPKMQSRHPLAPALRKSPAASVLLLVLLGSCIFGDDGSSFDWSVTPDRRTVAPGDATTFSIKIDSKENINSEVELSYGHLPPSATASFSQRKLPSTARTSTLTVTTSDQTPIGTYHITVAAKEVGHSDHGTQNVLFVSDAGTDPDFSLELDPLDYTFTSFEATSTTFTYFVRPLNGFAGDVGVALSDLGPNLYPIQDVTPPSVTVGGGGGAGGTFVLYAYADGPPSQPYVDITVTATSGTLSHSGKIRIHFPLTP
jgi:hypothetical protein